MFIVLLLISRSSNLYELLSLFWKECKKTQVLELVRLNSSLKRWKGWSYMLLNLAGLSMWCLWKWWLCLFSLQNIYLQTHLTQCKLSYLHLQHPMMFTLSASSRHSKTLGPMKATTWSPLQLYLKWKIFVNIDTSRLELHILHQH